SVLQRYGDATLVEHLAAPVTHERDPRQRTGGPRRDRHGDHPAVLRDWPLPSPGGGKESRAAPAGRGPAPSRPPGAARLTADAALRAGAGKLTAATPAATAATLAVALPEALVEPLPCEPGGQPGPRRSKRARPVGPAGRRPGDRTWLHRPRGHRRPARPSAAASKSRTGPRRHRLGLPRSATDRSAALRRSGRAHREHARAGPDGAPIPGVRRC
ncbi:MAG: hypothetical protein GEU96_20240, partial [Propionibacteriales bacterium]|nr:hypothetical protein [Propionibacteriales bacterium]